MRIRLSALLLILFVNSYAQDFYDINTIQTIEINFSQNNWDYLLDVAYSTTGDYIMADSVTINGQAFDSVGVKYKGNSTYNANQTKNPFHIELDTYKDHIYEVYTDIKLANCYKDPSFLRDVLSYQILKQYMDAPLANFAKVYVNGSYIGLYSNCESVSKKFVKSRFGSKTNTFFSCSPPDGANPNSGDYPNLVYLGQDSSNYYDAYEMKSDAGWQELIDLCDTLTYHIADIEEILDVDRALWMLAFDNALVNLDSYIGAFSQNYYLYRDDNNRFVPVVWDLNESFGVFSQTGSSTLNSTYQKRYMSHLLHQNDSDFPLVSKLLAVPMYKRMYLAHYKTLLLENFDNGSYYTTGQTLQALISSDVYSDGNKFYTYNNFISNLTSDINSGPPGPMSSSIPGITSLMNGRTSYLLNQSDFSQTQPTIASVTLSDTVPYIYDTITVMASVTNENTVYLYYRNETNTPFTQIQMYDDGAHDDGSANDGTYGAFLQIGSASVEYYIYAENSNIGRFSPVRAQHEFYTINGVASVQNSDLVINEFMASNDTTVADQDGEYDDWIELYNNGSSSIDLGGYYLSDDSTDITQWQFPTGTVIAANDYLIIWADNDENQTGLHTNFKLSASGEDIVLADAAGVILDYLTFPSQVTDMSYGRYPNGTGSFQSMPASCNAENISAVVVVSDVVINEFMASNATTVTDPDGEYEDWIELYNNGSSAIDLSGYFLADDAGDLALFEFPTGTSIAAGDYLIVWADKDTLQSGYHANFKLSSSGETIYFVDPTGIVLDEVSYAAQLEDFSYGRYPNGTGSFQSMTPSYNDVNTSLLIATADNVVINEFMASNSTTAADQNGEYDDWIEFFNNDSSSVDLGGYFLSDDSTDVTQWQFPAGTVIGANDYLIVWADNDENQTGLHTNFKLSASGEAVILSDTSGTIIDQISFATQVTDSTFGRYPNGTGDFEMMFPTYNAENIQSIQIVTGDLVINEFMASNDTTVADPDGEYEDWIELFNNGSSAIDMSGYYLSDDASDLSLFEFPEGTSIAAGLYLIVWADKDTLQTGFHANFKLSASGESIYLADASGTIIDQISYTTQNTDLTYARYPNGTGDFQLMSPTFNANNNGFFCCVLTNPLCNGLSTGSINITTTDGSSPYSFLWADGFTSEDRSLLAAGEYGLTVTDSQMNTAIGSWTITEPDALTVSAAITDVSSSTASDGAIDLTVLGGTSPYLYEWYTGATTEDVSGLMAGFYYVVVYDANACSTTDMYEIAISGLDTQYVELIAGWSLISTYIEPEYPLVDSVFSSVYISTTMVKNGTGNVYWPAFNLNLIGDMVLGEGYQVNMSTTETLAMVGTACVPELTTLSVPAGWSILGYLRQVPGDAAEMVSPIVSEVLIMKNSNGDVYWPSFGVNAMGDMESGQGYQINLYNADSLTYPANTVASKSSAVTLLNSYYLRPASTGNNMTIGIPSSSFVELPYVGDEVGVFNTDGRLVGSSVFDGGNMAIAVWGDDELSSETNGLIHEERFALKIWDGQSEKYLSIEWWDQGDGHYSPDAIQVIGKASIDNTAGLEYSLSQNSPNPFRETTRIEFSLPESSHVIITIFDLSGKVIDFAVSETYPVGNHSVEWTVSGLASGNYLYRIEANGFVCTKKMELSR